MLFLPFGAPSVSCRRGRAALQGRVKEAREERGFSPGGTGSSRNPLAADEYGYSSARPTNPARTGLSQIYSRCVA